MSGSVAFTAIPPNLRVPLFWVEFDPSRAGGGLASQRALIVAQAISVVPEVLTRITSADQARQLFGAGSIAALMVAAWLQNDTAFGAGLFVLPLQDDGGADAAEGALTLTGPASGAGSIALYVGGRLVATTVAASATATAMAAAVAAKINATAGLPVTATAALGVVTITARNGGKVGNQIRLALNVRGSIGGEQLPAGVGATIVALTGGAGDPDLDGIATAIGSEEFDFIVHHFNDGTGVAAFTSLMNENTGRWSYRDQLFGHVFTAKRGADSGGDHGAAALLTFLGTINDQHQSVWCIEDTTPAADFIAAATRSGAIANSLRTLPSRPVQTLQILGEISVAPGKGWTFAQQQDFLTGGGAVAARGDAGLQVVRCVTTRRVNQYSQADDAYLDVETLYTLAAISRRVRQVISTKYARAILADDGTRFASGLPVVTPKIMKSELIAIYADLEFIGLVENAAAFAEATIVERNPSDPSRMDVLFAPNLVSGLRIFALLNQFRLQ